MNKQQIKNKEHKCNHELVPLICCENGDWSQIKNHETSPRLMICKHCNQVLATKKD